MSDTSYKFVVQYTKQHKLLSHGSYTVHRDLDLKCLKRRTPAKELTEGDRYSIHSCSKQLQIDAIFIWFNDEMLFTLVRLGLHSTQWTIWRMTSNAAKNKAFCVVGLMTFSQSLVVIQRNIHRSLSSIRWNLSLCSHHSCYCHKQGLW